jgi:hypothetical protein
MSERTAVISITLPRKAGDPISVPELPQRVVDEANTEMRRRIEEAYDTGMRVVAEQLRDLLANGWRPDRAGVAEFCKQVEEQSPRAKR